MSDNLEIKDGNLVVRLLRTTDTAGVHTTHHIIDSCALPTGASTDRTTAEAPFSIRLSDGAAFYNAPSAGQLPAALVGGRLDVNAGGWMGSTAPTVGQKTMANSIPVTLASDHSSVNVVPVAASVLFRGKGCTFRTPGRAGTTGQNILTLHNAVGSGVTVSLRKVRVDMFATVGRALTVAPPIIRVWKITDLPTNGTVITKLKVGGTTTSAAAVVATNDASVDGISSASALGTTRPAGNVIAQAVAPRLITGAGMFLPAATVFDFEAAPISLAAGEGIVVFLDYVVATMNPTTDMWTVDVEWSES